MLIEAVHAYNLSQMERKVISHATYKAPEGEFSDMASATVPDQALSLKDILTRYTKGGTLPNMGEGYDEELQAPDPRTLDLTDIHDRRQNLLRRQKEVREAVELERATRLASQSTPPTEQTQQIE